MTTYVCGMYEALPWPAYVIIPALLLGALVLYLWVAGHIKSP
jgi:hypothetical protein